MGRSVARTLKDDVLGGPGTYLSQWSVTHLGPFSPRLAIPRPQHQLPSWSKAQSLWLVIFAAI